MADNDIRSNLSDKEQERLSKIDKLDANKKRKKIILAAVTAVLISFFVFGTIFGGIYILSYEGTEPLPAADPVYPPLPENPEEIIASFNVLSENTKKYDETKLDVSFDVNIPDESIVIEGDTAEKTLPLFSHIKPSVVSLISSFYEEERSKGEYGTDFSDYMYSSDFTAGDAKAEFIINEENENDLKYVFTFDKEKEKTAEIFNTLIYDDVLKGIKDTLSDAAVIKNVTASYDSFVLTANINREKNKLNSVSQKRICSVTADLSFTGDYADFGNLKISFTAELTKNYNFSYVELYFTSDTFYVTKGSSDEFKTKVISDESPAETVLIFTSSDPDVLSVDGRFFKANNVSKDPVTVTVEYTYKGVKYEDSCEFYVIVPVEGVKQNEKEISLKKGDSKELFVKISPDDATLTDVFWFTTDESIAAVDENGVVTAVETGSASVYCVTRDGNYKSSCTVNITE